MKTPLADIIAPTTRGPSLIESGQCSPVFVLVLYKLACNSPPRTKVPQPPIVLYANLSYIVGPAVLVMGDHAARS